MALDLRTAYSEYHGAEGVTHGLWYISECLLWHLVVLLYKYGTVPNAGYHSWNPLIVLFSSCDPLTEGYEYNRLSSVLILETRVYICRITTSAKINFSYSILFHLTT